MSEPRGPKPGLRGVIRALRREQKFTTSHRLLADRAHALAMAVLQSPAGPEFEEEIRAVLAFVTPLGEPRNLTTPTPIGAKGDGEWR